MRIENRQLRAFVMVADKLHFGQAAAALSLTQPALSRTIQQLEDAVGVALLMRSNRNVALTEAGSVFLKRARRLLEDLDDAVDEARRAGSGEIGRLRLGYTDFAIMGPLPEIIERFRQGFPEINIELFYGPSHVQMQSLNDDKLDFAFLSETGDATDIQCLEVQQESFVVLLYEGHPLASKARLGVEDLQGERLVLGAEKNWGPFRRDLDAIFQECGMRPNIVQEGFNSESIFGLVASGTGVSIHLECAGNYMRKGVVIRPLANVDRRYLLKAVWRNRPLTPAQQRFYDHLRKWVSS
ncbi:MAG: LysR family transcriptional regulator [Oceanospirillaceae bacterium]|nr:LysR family transcriptional regulator [Oceanospirillaceae bacterium]